MSVGQSMSDAEILCDVMSAHKADLPPEVAKTILKWKFSTRATAKMTRLAERNQKGTLSDQERDQLDRFLRIGALINVAQAKARLSLQSAEAR